GVEAQQGRRLQRRLRQIGLVGAALEGARERGRAAQLFLVGGLEGRSFVFHRASRSAVSEGRSTCSSSQRLRKARSARSSSTSKVPSFTPSRDAHTSRG